MKLLPFRRFPPEKGLSFMTSFIPQPSDILAILPKRDRSFEYSILLYMRESIRMGQRADVVLKYVLRDMAISIEYLRKQRKGKHGACIRVDNDTIFIPIKILPGRHGLGYFNRKFILGVYRRDGKTFLKLTNGQEFETLYKPSTIMKKLDEANELALEPVKNFRDYLAFYVKKAS